MIEKPRRSVLVLRHEPSVAMGSLAGILAAAGLDMRQFDLFDSVPQALPWSEAVGLIVLGGTMSANDGDRIPFIAAELLWIREAIERQVPLLGICLGSQLLAKALGSRVYRCAQPEIGWYQIDLLPAAEDDQLLRGRLPKETVFQWHGETFDLPPGAVHLAESPLCRHQAFRYGDRSYGLQFHVEMTADLLENWLWEYDGNEAACAASHIHPAAIRAEAAAAFPQMNTFSRCLLDRFAELCKECQAGD